MLCVQIACFKYSSHNEIFPTLGVHTSPRWESRICLCSLPCTIGAGTWPELHHQLQPQRTAFQKRRGGPCRIHCGGDWWRTAEMPARQKTVLGFPKMGPTLWYQQRCLCSVEATPGSPWSHWYWNLWIAPGYMVSKPDSVPPRNSRSSWMSF